MTLTLDQVVRKANADAGYKTLHRYVIFLHFAFDALFKLKRDNVINTQKFLSLNIVKHRIKIPDNVIGIIKLGIEVNGRVVKGVPDETMSINPDDDIVYYDEVGALWYSGPFSFIAGGTRAIPPIFGDFGLPRYKLDRTNKEIIVDRGADGSKVYVEVIEKGFTPGIGTLIPTDAALPMASYIHYRYSRFKNGASSAETKAAEMEYLDEFDEALASQSNFTGNMVMNALRF